MLNVSDVSGGVRFGVRVKPRSSKSQVLGVREGALEVALRAPPVEGAANDELVRLLARELRVGRTAVRIAQGGKSRSKLVEVDGLDRAELLRRLDIQARS
jgi:uncharacterized protein (TIGR00251 family)